MNMLLFVQSVLEGHLGCFHVWLLVLILLSTFCMYLLVSVSMFPLSIALEWNFWITGYACIPLGSLCPVPFQNDGTSTCSEICVKISLCLDFALSACFSLYGLQLYYLVCTCLEFPFSLLNWIFSQYEFSPLISSNILFSKLFIQLC